MLTNKDLKGNWGTLLLPINADDSIDFTRLAEEIDYLIEAGIDGIYSNGTAGELHNQDEDEFDAIQELLSRKCLQARMPFQIGAAHPSPLISLNRVRRSVQWKPSAIQVILPDWVTVGKEEQVDFLQKIATVAEGIPLVLYNPPHAKTVLQPADFSMLQKSVPQLVGIKVGSGDAQWYNEMRLSAGDISVFVPGHFLATGIREKVASGSYSNVACLNPHGAQHWWQLMQEDLPAALEVEELIRQFFDACIVPFKNHGYCNPALDKLLAYTGDWANIGLRLRWPYKWIPEAEADAVRTKAKKMLPYFMTCKVLPR